MPESKPRFDKQAADKISKLTLAYGQGKFDEAFDKMFPPEPEDSGGQKTTSTSSERPKLKPLSKPHS